MWIQIQKFTSNQPGHETSNEPITLPLHLQRIIENNDVSIKRSKITQHFVKEAESICGSEKEMQKVLKIQMSPLQE